MIIGFYSSNIEILLKEDKKWEYQTKRRPVLVRKFNYLPFKYKITSVNIFGSNTIIGFECINDIEIDSICKGRL